MDNSVSISLLEKVIYAHVQQQASHLVMIKGRVFHVLTAVMALIASCYATVTMAVVILQRDFATVMLAIRVLHAMKVRIH